MQPGAVCVEHKQNMLVSSDTANRIAGRGQALYSSLTYGVGGAAGTLIAGWTWEALGPSVSTGPVVSGLNLPATGRLYGAVAAMNDQPPPTEAEFLEAMKRSWASDFHFFSNAGKEKRERWVVHEFLSRRSITFSKEEIQSHEQKSKVDVEFRDALFQIKEIPEPGSLRSAEVEAIYRRVMEAKSVQETIGPGFVYDVPPPVNGYELVRDKAKELAYDARYLGIKGNLDLLLYLTRTRVALVQQSEVNVADLSAFGWRSISCLMGNQAIILFARIDAPEFLRHEGN